MSRDVRYPCLFNLIKTFHPLVDSGCWMLNLAEFLPQSCFTTPIFNGSFGVQGWNPIQVPALLKPWPLPRSWSKEEGIARRLGKCHVIWATCLISPVLLLPVFSAALASSSVGKIKPINTPPVLAFPAGASQALGCRGAGWWMLLRLGLGGRPKPISQC